MNFLSIDEDKCRRDGICVTECPAKIIKMIKSVPFAGTSAEAACIECGHCVSVCPEGALTLHNLSPEECMSVQSDLHLSPEHAEHFLKSRRSIRSYRKKPLEKILIEKAVSIASCAPSGSNKQPVRWNIIYEKEKVEKIGSLVVDWMRHVMKTDPGAAAKLFMNVLVTAWDKGIDRIMRDAPHVAVVYAPDEYGSRDIDCHSALSYLELVLPSHGAGSCWAGYLNYASNIWPGLKKELQIPEGCSCYGAILMGYPRFSYKRIPPRNKPKIRFI